MENTTINTVKEGDFQSLKLDDWTRAAVEDAYKAVTKANRWAFLRRPDVPGSNGFMFSKWPEMKDIDIHIEFGGHTGASYGMTMRVMEFIAKNGWQAYVKQVGIKPGALDVPQTPSTHSTGTTSIVDPIVAAAAVSNFLTTVPPTASTTDFVNAIQRDPTMRQLIPNIDEQADALREFEAGRMSYAEMRSLCG